MPPPESSENTNNLQAIADQFLDLRLFAEIYRASIRPATHRDFQQLEQELSDGEKMELASTSFKDWRAALHATEKNSLHAFVGSIDGVDGFVLFGATKFFSNIYLVWMLKTASFAESAKRTMGHRVSFLLRGCVDIYLGRLLRECDAVFNVISRRHTRNIRWLKQQKLDFYESPAEEFKEFFMFGKGPFMPHLAHQERIWKRMLD